MSEPNQKITPLVDMVEYQRILGEVGLLRVKSGVVIHVESIWSILNPTLEEAFMVRHDEMHNFTPDSVLLKFATVGTRSWKKIIDKGFRIESTPGTYGSGIYFENNLENVARATPDGYELLLCEVALGKSRTLVHRDPTNKSLNFSEISGMGYDSAYAKSKKKKSKSSNEGIDDGQQKSSNPVHEHFIVYHEDQAIPRYLILVKIIENPIVLVDKTVGGSSISASEIEPHPISEAIPRPMAPVSSTSLEYQEGNVSLLEGPVRWKKPNSTRWSERFGYVLNGNSLAIYKNASTCKKAITAIQADLPTDIVPECLIDLTTVESIEVKEELDVHILVITITQYKVEYFVPENAFAWMKVLLALRSHLKSYQTYEEDDSDNDNESATSSKPVDSKMAEYEARKAARKHQLGRKVELKQQGMTDTTHHKVEVYDETTGNWLGVLANDDAMEALPSSLTKGSLFKGTLAIKTKHSWKFLYCVLDGKALISYRSKVNESKKKLEFTEWKRWELAKISVLKSSHKFNKRLVQSLLIVQPDVSHLFVGKNIHQWIDYLHKFGASNPSTQPTTILTEKEKKRWNEQPSKH